jgi:hypothetical protein
LALGAPLADEVVMSRRKMRFKYGYIWVTLALFVFSLIGHWVFAWFDYVKEQEAHAQPIEMSEYFVKTMEATLENWQSEFLQLMWQVGGLMFLFAVGSPHSKESSDRVEEKIDWLMRKQDESRAADRIAQLEDKYPRK